VQEAGFEGVVDSEENLSFMDSDKVLDTHASKPSEGLGRGKEFGRSSKPFDPAELQSNLVKKMSSRSENGADTTLDKITSSGKNDPSEESKIKAQSSNRLEEEEQPEKFKILFWLGSLFALTVPVLIALEISPTLFPESFSSVDSSFTLKESASEDEVPFFIQVKNGASFAKVASDAALDPKLGGNFLLSFLVNLKEFPPAGVRQNILTKYQADQEPYPGWSVAIRNLGTSIRLQVYWQGPEGEGGWYAFEDLGLKLGEWYSLGVLKTNRGELVLTVEDPHSGEIRFAGGTSVHDVGTPKSSAALVIGSSREGKRAFRGELAQVFIAHPENTPSSREKTLDLLKGGGPSLVKKLNVEEVGFWLNGSGQDGSRFQRPIQLKTR